MNAILKVLMGAFGSNQPNDAKFFGNMDETCGRSMTINKSLIREINKKRMERSEGELRLKRFNNVFNNPCINSVNA
jgi:hypothetical protein